MLQKQKRQLNIFSASSMSNVLMRKAISFSLAFCFMFILSGLDIILAHAFTLETSAKSFREENNTKEEPLTKKDMVFEQYADLWQITSLNCLSESMSSIQLDSNSIVPDKNFYFLSEIVLKSHKDRVFNVSDIKKTSTNNGRENCKLVSLESNFVSETDSHLLTSHKAVALVGPLVEPEMTKQIEDTLICNIEQQSQLDLVLNKEENFLVTSLPEYLRAAINGGLSKARWKSSCSASIPQAAVVIQLKKIEITLNRECNEIFNHNVCAEKSNYKNPVYGFLKSSVMTTGPPAKEEEKQVNPSVYPETIKTSDHKKTVKAVKGINHEEEKEQYSLSYTDNVKNIKKITG